MAGFSCVEASCFKEQSLSESALKRDGPGGR